MDSVVGVAEHADIGFMGDGCSPRLSADGDNQMARKKKDVDGDDDVFIEGIEEELDSASEEALIRAADTVCKECMQIHRNENILIVTDPHTSTIGQALYEAAARISDRVLLVIMPTAHRHGDEPPAPVAELMRKQDVVLAPTRYSLTHTRARMQACREGTRIATMPGITMQMFIEGGMTTDFNAMQSAIAQLGKSLKRQRKVEVRTDLEQISDSRLVDDGNSETMASVIAPVKSPIFRQARFSPCPKKERWREPSSSMEHGMPQ